VKRLVLSLAFSLLASTALAFPVTVDSCGKPLTFDAAPKRAVIHDLNMTEMAFALGLQPSSVGLTGITGWYTVGRDCKGEQGSIPELAPKYPTMENLVAVDPDFFFAGWYYGMKPGGEVTPDTLAPHRIKTLVLTESCVHLDKNRPIASMDLLYGDVEKLGKIFGKEAKAQRLVSGWQTQLADLPATGGDRSTWPNRPRPWAKTPPPSCPWRPWPAPASPRSVTRARKSASVTPSPSPAATLRPLPGRWA